jgi:hypothetical protein
LRTTYIIIVCSSGPRKGLIEKQYFEDLRKHHGLSSKRNTSSGGLITIEMPPKQQKEIRYSELIEILGVDIFNQDMGESVLKNREAMYQDILSPYAGPILSELESLKKTISDVSSSLLHGFWKPKEQDSSKKCPFHR